MRVKDGISLAAWFRWGPWVAAVVILTIVAGVKVHCYRKYWMLSTRDQARLARLNGIQTRIAAMTGQPRNLAIDALADLGPFWLINDKTFHVGFADVNSGYEFQCGFPDGKMGPWRHFPILYSDSSDFTASLSHSALEWSNRSSLIGWLAGLIAAGSRATRKLGVHLMMAAGVLCFALGTIVSEPNYFFFVYRWQISIGVAMTMAGLVALQFFPKHSRPGQCQGCGYDLTGNLSGRCPECGVAVVGADHAEVARRLEGMGAE